MVEKKDKEIVSTEEEMEDLKKKITVLEGKMRSTHHGAGTSMVSLSRLVILLSVTIEADFCLVRPCFPAPRNKAEISFYQLVLFKLYIQLYIEFEQIS
eukprot:sb/3478905/